MNIAVFGLRRGGNHPIINWICRQLPGLTFHYNNVRRPGFDPYERCATVVCYRDGSVGEVFNRPGFTRGGPTPPRALFPRMDSDHVVHTYEDFELSYFEKHSYYEKYKDTPLVEIIILRDPYNWCASRIASNRKPSLKHWLEYAEEFIGKTNHLRFGKTPINYNEWFSFQAYRDSWLAALGIENHERGVDQVSGFGNGSSFDQIAFDGQAQKMKVLERWKELELDKDPEFMNRLKKNPRVREFAKKIFNMEFPGA